MWHPVISLFIGYVIISKHLFLSKHGLADCIVYERNICDVSCRGEQFKQSRGNRTASEYFMQPRAVINLNNHVLTLTLPFTER